jgi:hypothetical protein
LSCFQSLSRQKVHDEHLFPTVIWAFKSSAGKMGLVIAMAYFSGGFAQTNGHFSVA